MSGWRVEHVGGRLEAMHSTMDSAGWSSIGLALLLLCLPVVESASAQAEAGVPACEQTKAVVASVRPPSTRFAYLSSFESRVPLAFPIGSKAEVLRKWLVDSGFTFHGRTISDTAFGDEPAEWERYSERLRSNETINLAVFSRETFCGGMIYSVAWDTNDCDQIDEIHADIERCQFDLP
jgi:hypothetical protein